MGASGTSLGSRQETSSRDVPFFRHQRTDLRCTSREMITDVRGNVHDITRVRIISGAAAFPARAPLSLEIAGKRVSIGHN